MNPTRIAMGIWAATGARPSQPVPSIATVQALAGGSAEVMLYGLIGDFFWDGITADEVVAQIDALDVDTITVAINSRGGEVDHGTAIYNALKRHKARIVVRIDGQAGSIASLIAMAGDEVVMPPTALMMVHAPYLVIGGNAAQMRAHAERLDSIAEAMLEAYAAKTGDGDGMQALLTDGVDHWFTAAKAVELGLADRIEEFESQPSESAAAAALCGYVSAITHATGSVATALRGHIQAAAEPRIFASLPGPAQLEVITHIEDSQMKRQLESIYAAAAGGNAPANEAAATAAPEPAAPAAPATATTPASPAAAAAPTAPATSAVDQALAAQRDRVSEVITAARAHADNPQIATLRDEVLSDPALSVADFNARALAILGHQAAPASGGTSSATAGADERDQRTTAIAAAIDMRLGHTAHDGANPFRASSLLDIATACARAAGVSVNGMDRTDVVRAAITHTTSDFPQILGDAVRRAVLRGYQDVPEVFDQFTRAITVPDFRKTSLAGLGQFVGVDIVREGGEYKYGTFAEMGQEVKLEKAGALFSISDEAIINDDLNLLDAIPRRMGAGSRRNLGDRVFALLTGNPELADGIPLFHADHNNLVAPGSAISTATVDGMRVLMATQRDSTGRTIRVPLKFVVVPIGMGGLARTVLQSQYEVGPTNRNNTTPNIVRDSFTIIEDPRLDADDPNAWYGIADPAVIDGIVIAYRDGIQVPRVTQKEGWNVDGVEFKVRLDAAPAIADYVGLAKNPGAS